MAGGMPRPPPAERCAHGQVLVPWRVAARCLLNVFTFLFYLAAVFDLVLCAVVCACAANNNLMANADTHRRYCTLGARALRSGDVTSDQ